MTRTGNNKPSQSSPIRKGKMSKEEIEATAKELTKVPEIIQEVEAPKPEPVVKGDYKAFATSIKGKLKTQETVELTGDFIKSLFPQAKCAGKVVQNLKNSYGLSYRRVENGRNDTYVFFVEPTKEELTVRLASAESKVIEWEKTYKEQKEVIADLMKSNTDLSKQISMLHEVNDKFIRKIGEENEKLKSDLSNQHIDKIILLGVAILSVISIILK